MIKVQVTDIVFNFSSDEAKEPSSSEKQHLYEEIVGEDFILDVDNDDQLKDALCDAISSQTGWRVEAIYFKKSI